MVSLKIAINILLILFATLQSPAPIKIWVSPGGDNGNPGTQTEPLADIDIALRKARELRRFGQVAADQPVDIVLKEGTYSLNTSLFLRSQDSGTETSPTVITTAENERPVLSGGYRLRNWRRVHETIPGLPPSSEGNIWAADIPKQNGQFLKFHQIWVNGKRAVRARYPNQGQMERLAAWEPGKQEARIPASAVESIDDAPNMEILIDQVWEIARLPIHSINMSGEEASLTFPQPESRIAFEHPWPPVVMTDEYHAPFFLDNALQFLDAPGEWFEDIEQGKIYYRPRTDEDLGTAAVITPVLETLVRMEGSLDDPVAHVRFQGITFAYAAWPRPYEQGIVPLQAGMYMVGAYRIRPKGTGYAPNLDNQAWIGRPPAAVEVRNAHDISFINCRFEHTVSAGLDFRSGTHDDAIQGCLFRDIGGNGIQIGAFSEEGVETHFPYNPKDERVICSNETISNNLVTDCGKEDWGSVGICVGYGRNITIEHNELSNLPYTGISVGWGWTPTANCMKNNHIVANRIHRVATKMGDTGGIYTLSSQPGTVIRENSIYDITMSPYVFDPDHWFYIYLDEGSSFVSVQNNWCPSEKFFSNAVGPGNQWTNNGPAVSEKIKEASGLQPAYRHLLRATEN